MKRNNFNILLSFILILALMPGCNETHQLDPEIETGEISIKTKNPHTGEYYTQEELDELSYDPNREDYYYENQKVEIDFYITQMAEKVEVLDPAGAVLKTLTDFTEEDGVYTAVVEFTMDEFALEVNESTQLVFLASYISSDQTKWEDLVYKITLVSEYVPPKYPSPVQLIRKNGEVVELPVIVDEANLGYDVNMGTVLTHSGGSFASVVDNNLLNFRFDGDFSVGIWVNSSIYQNDPVIIGDKDWGSGKNSGFLLAHTRNNWKVNAGDGVNRVDVSGADINDGNWHFLTVTFDRDGDATIYTDGVQDGAGSMASVGNLNSGLTLNIGQDGTGGYGKVFEGLTAATFIYDYALTPEQVSSEFAAKGARLIKSDGSQKILAVNNMASATTFENNMVCYTLDGVDDLVTFNNDSDLDFRFENDFSVAVWVNTSVEQNDPVIFGDKDWGSGKNKGWLFAQTRTTWKMNIGDGTDRVDIKGDVINDGQWHLLGATFDRDGKATIYQDGVAVGEAVDMAAIGSIQAAENYPLCLGQDGTGNYGDWFSGKIANSMVFDYVLTPEQMQELYSAN